jgi:uncharacterized protein YjbI with pentapeptide repeats
VQRWCQRRSFVSTRVNAAAAFAGAWRADFREADLREADLREADLREADLREADLREDVRNPVLLMQPRTECSDHDDHTCR